MIAPIYPGSIKAERRQTAGVKRPRTPSFMSFRESGIPSWFFIFSSPDRCSYPSGLPDSPWSVLILLTGRYLQIPDPGGDVLL